jgi:serine/threonine protein kinase/tetratricopeptide (TPR) repeat protein
VNPDLHERATELFLQICDLPPEERDRILATTGDSDPELRDEVLSLLRHDEGHPSGPGGESSGLPGEAPPERVGAYRILEFLGAGGMAEVFLAEGETPDRPRVAVKILGPGPRPAEILARFETEREALAKLDHPAVATILDAGTAEDGRPYFAMEYVPGIAITEYCRRHRLPLRERLRLFVEVCDAVRHAHERGIIHRDLKPSNILVFLDEDRPRAKIIDFGVARAVGPLAETGPWRTHHGTLLGTPAYMSPEQAEMSALDIDPRTDIYSLGVLLNELLTGQLPMDWEGLRHASLEAIRRAIRESDPKSPSIRIEELGDRGRSHARTCRTDAASLVSELRGGLDEIVLRALDRDRTRRPATASELGAAIERWLRGDRAGRARTWPPARDGKLERSARWWLIPGLATLGALILTAVVGWLALRPGTGGPDASERTLRSARLFAARLQFDLERGDPEVRLSMTAELVTSPSPPPEAILVRAQAMIRTSRHVGSQDLERSAVGQLRQYEEEARFAPWPARDAVKSLLREISPRTVSGQVDELLAPDTEPVSAEDWYLLSFGTLDLERALRRARRAAELEPDDPLRLRRLANLCESTGRLEEALVLARRLVEMGHAVEEWTVFTAAVWLEMGDPRRALETLDSLPEPEGDSRIDEQALRAAVQLALGNPSEALAAYSELVSDWPRISSGYVYYRRATALWLLEDLDGAASDYETFRRIDRRATYADARLYFLRHEQARGLEAGGDVEAARSTRDRAAAELRATRESFTGGIWLKRILDAVAGELAPGDLVGFADSSDPAQLCEAYYYAGEICLLQRRGNEARSWFRKCIETGVVFDPLSFPPIPMNEFHLARHRLAALGAEGA